MRQALCLLLLGSACSPSDPSVSGSSAALDPRDAVYDESFSEGGHGSSVRVMADGERLTLLDTLTISVEMTGEDGFVPMASVARDRLSREEMRQGSWMMISNYFEETGLENSDRLIIELEPILAGDYIFGPFQIPFTNDNGLTEGHTITVESLGPFTVIANDPGTIPDLQGVGKAEGIRRDLPAWPWLLALGGAVVVAGIVLFILLRGRGERQPQVVRISPEEWAMETLRHIRDSEILETEGPKSFYYAVNATLREYIERRFELHAPALTTEEFVRSIHASDVFSSEQNETLQRYLRHCDEVKYAGGVADEEACATLFQTTANFITHAFAQSGASRAVPDSEPAEVPAS